MAELTQKEIAKLSPQQRADGFKEDYDKLTKKWNIDWAANVQPVMKLVDTTPQPETNENRPRTK